LEIAPALRELGVDAEVVALYRPGRGRPREHPWLADVEALGLPALQIQDPSPFSPRVVRRLTWALKRSEADILHTHDYRSNVLGGLVARQAGRSVPWVATVHLHTTTTRRLKVYRALDLFLLRLADRVVTVSRDQRRLLLRRGVDRRRIVLVPNVIDSAAFAERAAHADETRTALGVSSETSVITVIGRLTPQKGVDVLLEAMPAVLETLPHTELWVAGAGPSLPELEGQTVAAGLSSSVRYLGYRTDVASVIAASDVIVLPSRAEGLPVVLLEAMSLGKPVVASRVGGVPDLVRQGQTGWLVPSEDPAALAGALTEALAHRKESAERGDAGRRRVALTFAPERAARRLAAVYRTILAERS
jgi:glycosyltransferase involved in cell wall biosynthesis